MSVDEPTPVSKSELLALLDDSSRPNEVLQFTQIRVHVLHDPQSNDYHSPFGKCSHPPVLQCGTLRSAMVPLSDAIRTHHRECLSDWFSFISLNGESRTAPLEEALVLRKVLTDQLSRLDVAPESPLEAFCRVEFPFDFLQRTGANPRDDHSNRVKAQLMSWAAEYLECYKQKADLSLKALQEIEFESLEEYFLEELPGAIKSLEMLKRTMGTAPPKFSLVGMAALGSDEASPVRAQHAGFQSAFGVGRRGQLFLMPPLAGSYLELFADGSITLDERPSDEVIEALDTLYQPRAGGVYSDLRTAFEAASAL